MKQEKQKTEELMFRNEEVELKPLNDDLYDEFSIQELEQRLETDPWICAGYCNDFSVTLPDQQ